MGTAKERNGQVISHLLHSINKWKNVERNDNYQSEISVSAGIHFYKRIKFWTAVKRFADEFVE